MNKINVVLIVNVVWRLVEIKKRRFFFFMFLFSDISHSCVGRPSASEHQCACVHWVHPPRLGVTYLVFGRSPGPHARQKGGGLVQRQPWNRTDVSFGHNTFLTRKPTVAELHLEINRIYLHVFFFVFFKMGKRICLLVFMWCFRLTLCSNDWKFLENKT